MKKSLLLFIILGGMILSSINLQAQTANDCYLDFSPAANIYEPGDLVTIQICYKDYSAAEGKPDYFKADWNGADNSNDPATADLVIVGNDVGQPVTVTVL